MRKLLFIPALLLFAATGCKKDNKNSSSLATLTTEAAASVTANTAETGGNIISAGGSDISHSGVCWATHSGPTVGDSVLAGPMAGNSSGPFSSSLHNLFSYTKYYLRAFAINAAGTAYGNEITFTTSTGMPTVSTAAISNIAPLSAQSGGNILSDGGSPLKARGICWSVSPHPTTDNAKTTDSTTTNSFTNTATPLGSQLTYYIRAYATNDFGTSYGNELTFVSSSGNAVTDIDGNTYPYITIGAQTWTTSDLKTTHYKNGDPITDGSGSSAFYANWYIAPQPTTGAYAFPNGDPSNNDKYGKYYDNITVNDIRGICPVGWHIPSDDEWKALEIYAGMSPTDADLWNLRGTVGKKLLEGGSVGLNLQLAGCLFMDFHTGPMYLNFTREGYYWSSTTVATSDQSYLMSNWFRKFNEDGNPDPIDHGYGGAAAYSVRCVKD